MKGSSFNGVLFLLFFGALSSHAQIFNYTKNDLSVEVSVINPCDPSVSNGSITFKLTSSKSGKAKLLLITGPSTTIFPDFNFELPGTASFTFTPDVPQNGLYDFVIRDLENDDHFINTLVAGVDGVNLTALDPIIIDEAILTDNTDCSIPNGQIQATLSGGSKSPALSVPGSFTYTWTSTYVLKDLKVSGTWDGTGTLDPAALLGDPGLPGGTYTLEISDDYSVCTAEKTFTIIDASPVAYNLTPAEATGCIESDQTIQLLNSETAIVEYEVFENGNATGIKQTGTSAPLNFIIPASRLSQDGTYVYTIVASNGVCTPLPMTGNTTLTINTKVTITSTSDDPNCFGNSDGSVTLIGSGGSGTFEYSIDNGSNYQSSGSFTGLPAGTYQIIARDNNGCGSDSGSVTLSDPDPIAFSSSFEEPSCNSGADGAVTLTGTGSSESYTYSIDNGVTFQVSPVFTGLAAGIYNAAVKDTFGCTSATEAITITEPDQVTFTFSESDPKCSGTSDGAVIFTGTGGSGTYEYSTDNGVTFLTTSTIAVLSAGTYNLVLRDSENCLSAPATTTLTDPPAVTQTAVITPETCTDAGDATITISGAGGTDSFSYSIDGGTVFQASGNFNGLSSGDFGIVTKDSNECLSVVQSETIQPVTEVVTNFTSADPSTCEPGNDGTIILSATGGSGPYSFSKDDGTTFDLTGSYTGLSAGSFTVRSKDNNGCISEPVTVILEPPFQVTVNSNLTEPSCNGDIDGTLLISAAGGNGTYSFSIDNGVSFQVSGTFSSLAAGIYQVVAKDGAGCEGDSSVDLTEPEPVSFSATPDQVSCFGFTDGTIDIIAAGGNGPYQYSIDNGLSFTATGAFINLSPDTYQVVVRDIKNCPAAIESVTVTEPDVVGVSAVSTDVTLCDPGNDGALTASVTGGTAPFTFSLDGTTFQSSPIFTALDAGLYTIIAQDSRGCSEFAAATVNAPSGPLFFFSVKDLTCFEDNSGEIDITGFGGTSPLQYSSNGGTSFQSGGLFIGLQAGDYTLVVKDAKECKFEIPTTLFQPSEIIPAVSSTPVLCNDETNASISVTATGGVLPYEFSINNGSDYEASGNFINLPAGSYNVIVKDGNNCLSQSSALDLLNPPLLEISSVVTNAGCSNDNGTIQLTITGGTAPLAYEFNNNPAPFPSNGLFTGLSEGSYPFKVTDDRGCTEQETFAITFPGNIDVTAEGTAPDCNGNGDNGLISVNLTTVGNFQAGISHTPSVPPISFINVTNGSFSFNNLTNGTYEIVVTHNSLCPVTLPILITGGPDPVSFSGETIEKLCFEDRAYIRLSDIRGKAGLNFLAEITDGSGVYKSVAIPFAAASVPFEIDIPDGGAFQLILSQDQSSVTPCSQPRTAPALPFTMNAPASKLDTAEVVTKISLPDLPTGSLSGKIKESLEEPYEAKLELTSPREAGQSFSTDFEVLTRNSETGAIDFSYNKIFAGGYTFTLRDSFGCVKTYDLTIDFNPNLFIPNIFTPDGDGVNEEFYIRNLPANSSLEITDRWGQKIFSSPNYSNDWKAKGMPDGVYFYKLIIRNRNYTGWIEVLTGK